MELVIIAAAIMLGLGALGQPLVWVCWAES